MTHTYNVGGMTCNSCVAKVKSELLKVDGVVSAEVKLEGPQATVAMARHIPTSVLQQAIGNGKYLITDDVAAANPAPATNGTEKVSYYPIILIFCYITGITSIVQLAKGSFDWMQWMSGFMAGFFLLFSFFKLLDINAFADGYRTYDVIAKRAKGYGFVYPFIELLLGIAYLTGFQPLAINGITLVVMGISSIGVIQSLARKNVVQCACLGTIIKLPLSKVTLFEDLLMVAMSLAMVLGLVMKG